MDDPNTLPSVPVRLIALTCAEITALKDMIQRAVEAGAPLKDVVRLVDLYGSIETRSRMAAQIEMDAALQGMAAYERAMTEGKSDSVALWSQQYEADHGRGVAYRIVIEDTLRSTGN